MSEMICDCCHDNPATWRLTIRAGDKRQYYEYRCSNCIEDTITGHVAKEERWTGSGWRLVANEEVARALHG